MSYVLNTPQDQKAMLEKIGAGTLLVVTESGFDQLPASRRAEAFRMNEGGWADQIENIARHVQQAA